MNPLAQALMRPFGAPQASTQMQPQQQQQQPIMQQTGHPAQDFMGNMQRGIANAPGYQRLMQQFPWMQQSPFFGTMPGQRMPFGQ